jgi:hypothetical protein
MADLLAASYAELGIPPAHVRIFNGDLAGGDGGSGGNPFHGHGIHNPAYAADRAFFLKD